MKMRDLLFWPTIFCVGLCLCLIPILWPQTMYACDGKQEGSTWNSLLQTQYTGEPIQGAKILLFEEKEDGLPPEQHVLSSLTSDNEGRARFVRENNSCEDVIRPFRRTTTLIDLTWASLDVTADGFNPMTRLFLHGANYKDKGYFSKDHSQHVELTLPLQKRTR